MKQGVRYPSVRRSVLLPILILLTSCGDDLAPTDIMFDVASTNQALAAVRNVVMSPALDAHLALASRFTTPDATPLTTGHARLTAQQIRILPVEYLGTTFGLADPGGAFQPTELTGAPAEAIRFLIYPMDASGNPIVESAIGHADLTDDGVEMEVGFAVGVLVTVDDLVIADYATSFEAEGATAALETSVSALDHVGLDIAGTLRTTTDEIQIDMVTGTINGVITTEFTFTSGDATVSGQMMVEEESQLRLLQGEFRLGDDLLNVIANGGPNSFGAEITVGDNTWATVSVQPVSITVTGAASMLDSTEESVALRLAEYFLMVPNLAGGLVAGAVSSAQ